MAKRVGSAIQLPEPNLQIGFAKRLDEISKLMLGDALGAAVQAANLKVIDEELRVFAPERAIGAMAAAGVRGEIVFAVPCILRAAPRVIGYYRLLLGYSQKEFYQGDRSKFRAMEESGAGVSQGETGIEAMCRALSGASGKLIDALGPVAPQRVRDLQLLTLGAQLRGGRNNTIGQDATKIVFDLVAGVAGNAIMSRTDARLELRNASGRRVVVESASDPDLSIVEHMGEEAVPLVSIEIKGGRDVSNIHNRLGEAEKSHLKARARGFTECWTILNAPVSPADAKRASPTTTKFFQLADLQSVNSAKGKAFWNLLRVKLGLQ